MSMFRIISAVFSLLFLLTIAAASGTLYVLWHFGQGLPDYRQLATYEPSITSRFYAGDGLLLAEYATEKRFFVPYEAVPKQLVHAFLSAEDKNFWQHSGVDPVGIARAVVMNVRNYGSGRRMVGASTITQQVAKNFLLTSERTITRKIKEAILAFRIERTFDKEHILELYLNEIYLGYRSYGVAIAAMNYFSKSLDELSLSEIAFLAALPKAPNNYNPERHMEAAVGRRNWVLSRMEDDGHISEEAAALAMAEPLIVNKREATDLVRHAAYFTEEVRREIRSIYGNDALYEGGLSVRTTLEPRLQDAAWKALRTGLEAYDRNRGYAGPVAQIDLTATENWQESFAALPEPKGLNKDWRMALVLEAQPEKAVIAFADGSVGYIPLKEMEWARKRLEKNVRSGDKITKTTDVVAAGDVVLVAPLDGTAYSLKQDPKVEGALVALDPHTGRVLAMVGGYSYARSQFNRAVQAKRQPGSAFKPFVYLAALERGYTPSTLILDAPFVLDQGPGKPKWKPANYSNIFYGPTTLRVGVEKSRNLMTVRLAQAIGMESVTEIAERFGIGTNLPPVLSVALGAGEVTVLDLTSAYAVFVNGGRKIKPTMVDRVQDRHGKTIYRHDERACPSCTAPYWMGQDVPVIPDVREQLTDPLSAYQITSILNGVVERGTGRRAKIKGYSLAGKTGTTNDYVDAWFVGFGPDLAVGVFVGLDEPQTLGPRQAGGGVAAPIFKDFMAEALKETPATPFRIPSGIRLVRVNHKTGKSAEPGDKGVVTEAFKPHTKTSTQVIGGDVILEDGDDSVPSLGDLY